MELKKGDKVIFSRPGFGREPEGEVAFNELHNRIFGTGIIVIKSPLLGEFPSSNQMQKYKLDANTKYLYVTDHSELTLIPETSETVENENG